MSSPRFKNNKWSEGKLNILVLNIITLVSENFKVFCFNSQRETLFIHIKNEVTKFKTSGMIVATKVQKRYELHGNFPWSFIYSGMIEIYCQNCGIKWYLIAKAYDFENLQ